MAKAADVAATTHKERKPPKKISHLEIHEGENGGHVIRHVHTHYEHPTVEHIFGASEGGAAMKHIAEHANISMADVGAGEGSEEATLESKESAEA